MPKSKSQDSNDQVKNLKSFKAKSEPDKLQKEANSLEEFKSKLSTLSYEESLNSFDDVLKNLQSDHVAVEDLQAYYLRGNLYLEHCESLLKQVEQEVVELDIDDLVES